MTIRVYLYFLPIIYYIIVFLAIDSLLLQVATAVLSLRTSHNFDFESSL